MKTTIQITDVPWFNYWVQQVDTEMCCSTPDNSCHEGNVNIHLKDGSVLEFQGQHRSNDFERAYAFKLVAKIN